MNHYNIMTSCDNAAALRLAPELMSISYNLKDDIIDFYLFHSRVCKETIEMLDAFCKELKNIIFHEIIVPNPEDYEAIGQFGGGYLPEAYYSVCAHALLPESVDRILYLDAGDILVMGDISPYYNYDFEGRSIIAAYAGKCVIDSSGKMFEYTHDDLQNLQRAYIIAQGTFNSGSYVMNIEKMRIDNMSTEDFVYLSLMLKQYIGDIPFKSVGKTASYWGDEGLLSVAYAGDIRYYKFPECQDLRYAPYNFHKLLGNVDYEPVIYHYIYPQQLKPWNIRYPIFIKRFQKEGDLHSIEEIDQLWKEYFYWWHMYAMASDALLNKIGY